MNKLLMGGLVVFTACATEPPTTEATTTDPTTAPVTVEDLAAQQGPRIPNDFPIINQNGLAGTFNVNGDNVGLDGPFFTSFGTNGRVCATCHEPTDGWTITPAHLQVRFDLSGGTDPVFRTVDGSTSPNADVSTVSKRRTAYSMLLSKGDIRIGIGIPSNAQFTLSKVDDPYHFASAAQLSLFRRPLPSTNLRFLATVMWDGREATLTSQATDATLGHAQATSADPAQMAQIVGFESSISTAQVTDDAAGALDGSGALGGTAALAAQSYTAGENGPFDDHTPTAFALYDAWAGATNAQQASIARGQAIFNTTTIFITGVAGVNDVTGLSDYEGTCASCHDAANAGNLSINAPVDIGVSTQTPGADVPVYTFRRTSDGTMIQTTDPGMALITGKWADMNKFQVPVLRGLAMRPPYFHDGSAATLADVVTYYNSRFNMALSAQDQADLVAFLQTL